MRGKRIGIFCTSTPLSKKSKNNYEFLRSNGFEVYELPQVRNKTGHLAGTIEERVSGIYELLRNESIDILMAYWGGANTNQILPYLDYKMFEKYPKPIIGFSDTSALLLAVNKLADIKTYMGPAGITFDKPEASEYSLKYLEDILIDNKKEVEISDSQQFADDLYFLREDSNHRILQENKGRKVFRHGKAEAEIIASNLCTLLVLAGTKYFPDLNGKALFIEEDESTSTAMIHRFFTQLSQIQDLNKLAAIFIGRFPTQCGFNDLDTEEMIYEDVFRNIEIPIVYNLDFGHTDPLFTIPIGGRVSIDTQLGKLVILNS